MTAAVPQAAVDAAMNAMGCIEPDWEFVGHSDEAGCFTHQWQWTPQGCSKAAKVAAAVVAAVQGPIKAETWGEAADLIGAEHRSETRRLAEYSDEYGLLGNWLGGFRESEKMLRKRAAEIEAQP